MSRDGRLLAHLPGALASAALLAILAAPASVGGKEIRETRAFKSDRLEVCNLIGEVRVEGHRGSGFEVEVTIKGADAGDGVIQLDAGDDTLNIVFPEASEFVYPALGRSSSRLRARDSEWLSKVGAKGRIDVQGSGSGLEVWADVVIRAPQGHEVRVRHAVGRLIATEVDADLDLSTRNGDVVVEGTRGLVQVSTGSGDVSASRIDGERTQIATGSGDVEVADCAAQRVNIATGSGDVTARALDGRRVQVATGSGDVDAREVSAEGAQFATGSGKIVAMLSRMGDGEYDFGTGSGDIVLTLPGGASANIHAETEDGEIDVALDDKARYAVQEDYEVRLTIGGGGAKVNLGTGSGDIRIRN